MAESLEIAATKPDHVAPVVTKPSKAQMKYLSRGLAQPGWKLPLFDENGQAIGSKTIQSCIKNGWAEPWFSNPTKPDWLVCKLTDVGRAALET